MTELYHKTIHGHQAQLPLPLSEIFNLEQHSQLKSRRFNYSRRRESPVIQKKLSATDLAVMINEYMNYNDDVESNSREMLDSIGFNLSEGYGNLIPYPQTKKHYEQCGRNIFCILMKKAINSSLLNLGRVQVLMSAPVALSSSFDDEKMEYAGINFLCLFFCEEPLSQEIEF